VYLKLGELSVLIKYCLKRSPKEKQTYRKYKVKAHIVLIDSIPRVVEYGILRIRIRRHYKSQKEGIPNMLF
jgi:acyl-CoA synthetase (AMP-forming)/AMP-acid ligase II